MEFLCHACGHQFSRRGPARGGRMIPLIMGVAGVVAVADPHHDPATMPWVLAVGTVLAVGAYFLQPGDFFGHRCPRCWRIASAPPLVLRAQRPATSVRSRRGLWDQR